MISVITLISRKCWRLYCPGCWSNRTRWPSMLRQRDKERKIRATFDRTFGSLRSIFAISESNYHPKGRKPLGMLSGADVGIEDSTKEMSLAILLRFTSECLRDTVQPETRSHVLRELDGLHECARVSVYMCVYGRYMYICASKRPIDSARWLLHFNNSHIDGLRFIYGVYFVFADRWSSILGTAARFENHQRFVDAVLKCVKFDFILRRILMDGPGEKSTATNVSRLCWKNDDDQARARESKSLRVARERRDVESWLG